MFTTNIDATDEELRACLLETNKPTIITSVCIICSNQVRCRGISMKILYERLKQEQINKNIIKLSNKIEED